MRAGWWCELVLPRAVRVGDRQKAVPTSVTRCLSWHGGKLLWDTLGPTSNSGGFCGTLLGRVSGRVGSVSRPVRAGRWRKRLCCAAGLFGPGARRGAGRRAAQAGLQKREGRRHGCPEGRPGPAPGCSEHRRAAVLPLPASLLSTAVSGGLRDHLWCRNFPHGVFRCQRSCDQGSLGCCCWMEADGDLCDSIFVAVSEVCYCLLYI